jgi:hypothetical protein
MRTEVFKGSLTPANLFMIAATNPGGGKSRCYDNMAEGFRRVYEAARCLPEVTDEPESTDGSDAGIISAESVARRLVAGHWSADGQPPVLFTEDVTARALAEMLMENRECLSSISSDGRDVVNAMTQKQHGRAGNLQSLYLKGFSEDSFNIGRVKTRIHLEAPNLSILWLTQLDQFDRLVTSRSTADGGFLSRCLLARYESDAKRTDGEGVSLDEEARQRWNHRILELLGGYRLGDSRHTIQCGEGAIQLLMDYRNVMADHQNGILKDVRDYVVRYPELAIRLALVLHGIEHGAESHKAAISEATARNAITIVKHYQQHLLDAIEAMRTSRTEDRRDKALKLLAGNGNGQTARWFQQRRIGTTAAEAEVVLDQLVRTGRVRCEDQPAPARGGRSTRTYHLVGSGMETAESAQVALTE